MRILIDILHPAHVHFFRSFMAVMKSCGHEIMVTARDKECVIDLLKHYGIPFTLISTQASGVLGLGIEMVTRSIKLHRIAQTFRPDFMTGVMGPSIAVVGKFHRSKTVVFYNTEMARITNWFAYPLADYVCTPSCYHGKVRSRHVTYPGYQALAYLHPDRFQPDFEKIACLGIKPDEPYFLLRFVSWQASHDVTEYGITSENKLRLVELLKQYGRVFISSEMVLPPELQQYAPEIPVHDIHHLMAYARLLVGESATMASECAVLGVPSVYIAKTSRGYIDEQKADYGLVSIFTHRQQDAAIEKVVTFARDRNLKGDVSKAQKRLLEDKIDVTQWMVDFFNRIYGPG